MGYFEAVATQFIRKLKDGRKVFFPQGVFVRAAYVIEFDKIEAAIRHRIKVFQIFFVMAMTLFAGFFGSMLDEMTFGVFLFFLVVLGFVGWALNKVVFLSYTLKMEKIKAINSLSDWWNDLGEKGHPLFIIGGIVVSFLFIFIGVYFYIKEHNPKMLLVAIVFILILIPYLMAGYHKLKKR